MKKAFMFWSVAVLGAARLCFALQGEPDYLESTLSARQDVVFYGGFEGLSPGSAEWKSAWGVPFMDRADKVQTVSTGAFIGSKSLRVDYPQGGVGPTQTGTQFPINFDNLTSMPQKAFDSLYLRYYVKFEQGFDFRLGGKLPGLMGGNRSWSRSGGNLPDGTNGWTLRFMWRANGKAVVYAYLPFNSKYGGAQWGLDIPLNKNFETDKWHCIEQFCKINTVGQQDGKLYAWLDGERVLTLDDVTYRTVDNAAGKVGGIYFSTFHGGNTSDWAPNVTSYAQYDGIVAATSRVGTYLSTPAVLQIITPQLPSAVNGFNYSHTLIAENGASPYSWSVSAGSLPSGLTLSPSGVLSGTPTADGSFTFTINVTDGQNVSATKQFTLTISSAQGINLANGFTHSADSENLDFNNPISGLWDGDTTDLASSCPGSQTASSFWVTYDLTRLYSLSKIRLFGDATGSWVSKTYTVEIRENESSPWIKIVDNANCFADQWFETMTTASVRYIKLTVIGDVAGNKVQAREFEVYGIASGTTDATTFSKSALHSNFSANWNQRLKTITVSNVFEPNSARYSIYTMQGRQIALAAVSYTRSGAVVRLSAEMATSGFLLVVRQKDNADVVVRLVNR